jgi:hypothetical protein
MAVGFFGKLLFKKGASKVSPTITKVKPSVPKTRIEKAKSKLAIAKQKTKASEAKLNQTRFRIEQQRDKKMGGGFMGKRMGYKGGSKPDFLDLDKDGNTSEPMKQAAKQAKKK